MARPNKFWDRHAKGYAKRPVADEESYQKKLKSTQEHLKPEMEVLEFGCGTASTAIIHAPHVKHIKAIDISEKMLAIAQAKAESANVKNITFEQSSIDELSATDATYDAVMGHSILHLLEDREAVMAKVCRMLKPGGIFVTSTACLGGTMPLLKVILPIGQFFGLLPLVKFFTAEELAGNLSDAGFRIEHQWQPAKNKDVFIVATKA